MDTPRPKPCAVEAALESYAALIRAHCWNQPGGDGIKQAQTHAAARAELARLRKERDTLRRALGECVCCLDPIPDGLPEIRKGRYEAAIKQARTALTD